MLCKYIGYKGKVYRLCLKTISVMAKDTNLTMCFEHKIKSDCKSFDMMY